MMMNVLKALMGGVSGSFTESETEEQATDASQKRGLWSFLTRQKSSAKPTSKSLIRSPQQKSGQTTAHSDIYFRNQMPPTRLPLQPRSQQIYGYHQQRRTPMQQVLIRTYSNNQLRRARLTPAKTFKPMFPSHTSRPIGQHQILHPQKPVRQIQWF